MLEPAPAFLITFFTMMTIGFAFCQNPSGYLLPAYKAQPAENG
jgi:hypothetical protein